MALNEEEKKQDNKKEKLTESLHLTVEMTKECPADNLNPRKRHTNEVTAETTKRL